MKAASTLGLVVLLAVLGIHCDREDGLPDPPLQMLVPCDPSAAPDSPSACPPDAAVPVDGSGD